MPSKRISVAERYGLESPWTKEATQDIKFLWPTILKEKPLMIKVIIATLILGAAEILIPVTVGRLLHTVRLVGKHSSHYERYVGTVLFIMGIVACLAIIRGIMTAVHGKLAGSFGEKIVARLRHKVWRHLLYAKVQSMEKLGAGRILLRFNSDARAIQRFVTDGLARSFQDVVLAAGLLAGISIIDWRLGLAILVVLPAHVLAIAYFNPRQRYASRRVRRRRSRLSVFLSERIPGIVAIKASNNQQKEDEGFRKFNRSLVKRSIEAATIRGKLKGVSASLSGLSKVVFLGLACIEATAGSLSSAQLFTVYLLFSHWIPVIERLMMINRSFQEVRISINRIESIIATPVEETTKRLPSLEVTNGTIVLENVHIALLENEAEEHSINATFQRGKLSAVTGPNGSGKSTLLKALSRFHDVSSGKVEIDSQDISQCSLTSVRDQSVLVQAEPVLFSGTVWDNIVYGSENLVDEGFVMKVAEFCGVDKIVSDWPERFQAKVGDGGRNLSEGQKFRITLARALVSDPPILLIDLNVTDTFGEEHNKLTAILKQLSKTKTVIVATQALDVLWVSDQVMMFEGRQLSDQTNRFHKALA